MTNKKFVTKKIEINYFVRDILIKWKRERRD